VSPISPQRLSFRIALGLLFFVSGFTGLLYEVIWAKYLALLLGSTAYAQVGVLAVFMAGLAIGSVVWGAVADRSPRPLVLYGVLEIGIGLSAAAFAFGFDWLSRTYWEALATVGSTGVAAVTVQSALCTVAMFPPTFCMGGTLPLLSRALGLQRAGLGRGVAYLYAVNSFGAAAGAVLTGFYLVATWGFDAPFFAAAGVNVIIGLLAMALGRWMSAMPPAANRSAPSGEGVVGPRESAAVRGYLPLVLAAAAISGAVAMLDEVAWIRLCSLVLGSSTYSFSVMLAAFIVGIAAGSFVYTCTDPARRRPLCFFACTSLGTATTLLLCLLLYDRLPFYAGRLTAVLRQHEASFFLYQVSMLVFCIAVMLPLTFMSGLNFPALAHAAGQARGGIGRPVSQILFANTTGTIVGAVGGGLYLLPLAGMRGSFLIGSAVTVVVALAVLACDRCLSRRRFRWLAAVAVLGAVAYGLWAPAWDLTALTAGEFRSHQGITDVSFGTYRDGLKRAVVFYRDGASDTVSVERWAGDEIVLRVNGKADASALGDRDTQMLLGHLPAVLHPGSRRALVIGYGSGMTVGALLQHPIEAVDVVEISPEVIAADEQFRWCNHDPLHDRRTHLHIEDARTFLYRTANRYDLIISEPSNPWVAGVGNLFTQEFFDQARSHLAPGGLLVQWFHTYEISASVVRLILRTIADRFPDVRVFQSNSADFLVVASAARPAAAQSAMEGELARAVDLHKLGIKRPGTLLGLEVAADAAVRRIAGRGSLNRDRLPLLEYAAPRAFFAGSDSELLAGVERDEADGYLQSVAALSADEYAELFQYMHERGMEDSGDKLRLMAVGLARAPASPVALQWMNRFLATKTNSPRFLRALVDAAAEAGPATEYEYVRLLLRIVRFLHFTVRQRDIAVVAPLIESVAQRVGDGGALLQQLGLLYADARAYKEAVGSFDAALAQSAANGGRAPVALQCARGVALEKTGAARAARAALEQCLRGDASNPEALAALRRLERVEAR
jgi:spermidine synthase